MICLQGKSVCGGTVLGETYIFCRKKAEKSAENKLSSSFDEIGRLEIAILAVKDNLLYDESQAKSDTAKEILEIHRLMLEDEDVLNYLHNSVNKGLTAKESVIQTQQYFSKIFRDTNDEYMIARIDDVRDVCGRLTAFLSNEEASALPQNSAVLVADELLPSDLASIGKENILGIVLGSGTPFSHTSILIKEMGIPAIICENIKEIKTGMTVVLNGNDGSLYIEPDSNIIKIYNNCKDLSLKSNKTISYDKLYANIGNFREISGEFFEKCDGIGLFRTEYLYIGRSDLPDEEEHFSVYREILEKSGGKVVTVRTFDIGSDKSVDSLPIKAEDNPALGYRGLRVYSLYPDAFKTQIKALLRAAVYGNLRIMYPMVTSCEEIDNINQILLQTAQELKRQGIPYKLPVLGAMIETPAAALLSDKISKKVDFLSVGTNDLAQYTLAIDRQNGCLDSFCDKDYQAVMSLIEIAAINAHNNGIEIGICGDLASLPEFIEKWRKLGIDYISVSPSLIR